MQKLVPDIKVALQVRNSIAVRELVRNGVADLGFVSDGFSHGGIKAELATGVDCVLVFNPANFSLPSQIDDFTCLSDLPFITYPREDVLRAEIELQFRSAGAALNVICETAYCQHICSMAARGFGVGIVSSLSLASAEMNALAVARLAKPIISRLYSVQQVGIQQNRQTATFLGLALNHLANAGSSRVAPYANMLS
jgi:DNA-binding transcriptional LysR family regulator